MPSVDATAAQLYGIDLRIDNDGDLVVGSNGDLILVEGAECVAQALMLRLRTALNSLPMHPEYGSALMTRLVGLKMADPALVLALVNTETRKLIASDRRFVAVISAEVTSDPAAQTLAIPLSLRLAGGDALQVPDLMAGRADEMAMDLAELADLEALGDLYATLTDTVDGIDPADPDYGDTVDFSQLLDEAAADDGLPESE